MVVAGKFFKVNSSVLSIQSEGDNRIAVMIPEGAIIRVVSGPRGEDRMLDVEWEGRPLSVFTEDFIKRCREVQNIRADRSASA